MTRLIKERWWCCLLHLKVRLHIVTKTVFAATPTIFLLTFFLPKSKPILLGILYRPPDKLDFVKQVKNVFTETGVLNKQERYLAGNLNINVILGEK